MGKKTNKADPVPASAPGTATMEAGIMTTLGIPMINTTSISRLGTRSLVRRQGTRCATIPATYFENVNAESIESFDFYLAEDGMMILVPVFKKAEPATVAPSPPAERGVILP